MWRGPVGDGANLTLVLLSIMICLFQRGKITTFHSITQEFRPARTLLSLLAVLH